MKRTDLAAPTVIDPAAFSFVAGTYFGSDNNEEFAELLGEWMAEKDATGLYSWYSTREAVRKDFPMLTPDSNFTRKGTCDHCGAQFKWGSVYVHTSGKHIVVGNVCADKTMDVPSRLALDEKRMKSRIAAAREAARQAEKARAEAVTGGYEWLYTSAHDNATLKDIARKGLAWGGLTAAQVGLVKRLHDGTPAEWEVKKAARAAADAAAEPVPVTGARISVRGVVLSTKTKEGFMPGESVLKMLVKTDAGYKLWGSAPSSLLPDGVYSLLSGKTVEFSAKIERSKDDAKFGFFSRPTKARIIEQAVV